MENGGVGVDERVVRMRWNEEVERNGGYCDVDGR